LNTQPGGQNIALVQHANEITFAAQGWQSATPNYYIPRTIILSQSILVGGYYTSKLVFGLNPIATNLKMEHNQLLN
jgi:hypothetical protein